MNAKKVTEMSRDELVQAIYTEYDGSDHKQFKYDTMAAIGEWLENGEPVTESDTVETLAADWAEYNAADEE
jgi:hypothetical protein